MKLICDFCGSDEPTVLYRLDRGGDVLTTEFTDGSGTYQDSDEWLACAECEPLIDARDVDGLVIRGHANPVFQAAMEHGLTWAIIDERLRATLLVAVFSYPFVKRPWAGESRGPQTTKPKDGR